MAMKMMMSCKQAAALLVAREDRALAVSNRVGLRIHLWACKACPNFEKQLLTMREGLKQWRNYTQQDNLDNEAV